MLKSIACDYPGLIYDLLELGCSIRQKRQIGLDKAKSDKNGRVNMAASSILRQKRASS